MVHMLVHEGHAPPPEKVFASTCCEIASEVTFGPRQLPE